MKIHFVTRLADGTPFPPEAKPWEPEHSLGDSEHQRSCFISTVSSLKVALEERAEARRELHKLLDTALVRGNDIY